MGKRVRTASVPSIPEVVEALSRAMRDDAMVVDRGGRFVMGHPRFRDEDVDCTGLGDFAGEAEAQALLAVLGRVMDSGTPEHVEYRVERGGRVAWYAAAVSPLTNETAIWLTRDITDLKLSTEDLARWKERHLALVNSVDAILWEASADFSQGFTFVSEQAERLLGYPIERWLSDPNFWASHIYKEDRDWCLNLCLTETAAGRDHDFEYRMVAADGRLVWLRDIVTVVMDDSRPVSLRGVMIDITALKETFDRLSAQEAEYRSIFESTSDGLVINDMETGVILAANPAFCSMHGYDDMTGMHPTRIIHPDNHQLFHEYLEVVRRGGEFRGKAQDIRRDGSIVDVEVIGRGFTYKGRQAVLGVVRDITEQLRSEQQYQLIFESTTDSLLIHASDDLRVMDANAAAGEMFGYSREELLGMSPSLLLTDYDPDFVNAVKDGKPRRTRAIGVRKDGSTFQMEATGVPFVFRGEPHLLCIQRDITDQQRAYQLLEQRVAERTHEIERRRLVAEGLSELLAVVNSGRSLDRILLAVVEQCRRLLESDASAILLPETPAGDTLVTRASGGLAGGHESARLPVSKSAAGWAFSHRRPAAVHDIPEAYAARPAGAGLEPEVEDLGTHARVTYLPPGSGTDLEQQRSFAETYKGFLAIPLASRDQVYGALTLNYHQPKQFTPDEVALAIAFADQASIAIENARLQEHAAERQREAERRTAVAEGLSELLAVVNSGRSLDEMLEAVVNQCRRLLASDAASIFVPEAPDADVLVTRAAEGMSEEHRALKLPIDRSAVGWAFSHRRPAAVPNVLAACAATPEGDGNHPEVEEFETHVRIVYLPPPGSSARGNAELERSFAEVSQAVLAIPLTSRDQVYGALSLMYHLPRRFSEEEISLALAFADQASIAIENARLHEHAAERTREIERRQLVAAGLRDLLAVVNSGRSLDEMLEAIVEQARVLLQSDASSILLPLSDEPLAMSVRASTSVAGEFVQSRPIVGSSGSGLAYETQRPAAVYNLTDIYNPSRLPAGHHPAEPHFIDRGSHLQITYLPEPGTEEERIQQRDFREVYKAFLAVPLTSRDQAYGVLRLIYKEPREFKEEDIVLAMAFADQASLALENARLSDQARQAATLEERQRLARELHDAVTQTLFSTSLIAEVVPGLWESKPELARNRLEDLRRLTRGALAEMRTLLLELRPGALTELPLSDLLKQLSEATAGRTSLRVRFDVQGQAMAPLPGDVQVALYRVAQESLNNVTRHAQASTVAIALRYEDDGSVAIEIADDGRGFDPCSIPPGHLGVGIMRERAEAIGAALSVVSGPGEGTRVQIEWRGDGDGRD